jgi:hypothetical protein
MHGRKLKNSLPNPASMSHGANMAVKRFKRRLATISRLVILPYKIGSLSAKLLANRLTELLGLKVRRVRHEGKYRPKLRSLIANYGSASAPAWPTLGRWINSPHSSQAAGNKLRAFEKLRAGNVATPEWTTDRQVAKTWVESGGVAVIRTILNGHSGRGIILADVVDKLVDAPLYTKYKKKRKEFRVHVFQGKVIDVSEKRRRRVEVRPVLFDGYIRNLANGWVFCRDGVVRPADLDSSAIAACAALGLDFGAVDVIWNERENKSYVLEVNTAPGLQGTTLENYAQAIASWTRNQV